MGLIIKGEHNIISKKEMANKVAQDLEDNANKGTEKLSDSQKEVRSAKRHREFMQRVADKKAISTREERKIAEAEVITTPEIITEARAEKEAIMAKKSVSLAERPDFASMTKKEIDMWAEENLGLSLDRRKTKADLIAQINENL
jgi:hypothetical protein